MISKYNMSLTQGQRINSKSPKKVLECTRLHMRRKDLEGTYWMIKFECCWFSRTAVESISLVLVCCSKALFLLKFAKMMHLFADVCRCQQGKVNGPPAIINSIKKNLSQKFGPAV